jgi:N-sulfoglucosamine sulfohydrolase
MRQFLFTTLLALGLELSAGTQPNVLLFMSDDLSWHDLGCYGNADVRTPNIDHLATEGMRFEHCYNSAPMCAPTRMSLYTGIHPVRNGAHPNHSRVHPHIRSLPHYLDKLGYQVALLGKRHEMPESSFPFQVLGGRHHDNGDGVDLDLDLARQFMITNAAKPWCLVVTSNQPHTPWNRGDSSPYNAATITLPKYLVDTPVTREAMTHYYAEISYMDAQLGSCLSHLRESGQTDETIVIYLSEQGSNFPHCKWTCYDSGLRSAALVRWPTVVKTGSVSFAMIQYIDILPTLIEAAGGNPMTHDFDGRSLLPVLRGERSKHRDFVFGIQTSKGIGGGPDAYGIRTVRDDRYRLIWNLNWQEKFSNGVTRRFPTYQSWKVAADAGDSFAQEQWLRYQQRPELELYDLQGDPYEMKNLANDPREQPRIKSMRRELAAWMKQQGDKGDLTERAALERTIRRTYK